MVSGRASPASLLGQGWELEKPVLYICKLLGRVHHQSPGVFFQSLSYWQVDPRVKKLCNRVCCWPSKDSETLKC